jgi:excisionase family DNA binding protein
MAEVIQFIQVTPEKLLEAILEGVKTQLENLKKDFQPKTPTEYLSRSEAAELLKVDLSTIHNWTKKGKLQAFALGGRIFYRRDLIEQSLIPLK